MWPGASETPGGRRHLVTGVVALALLASCQSYSASAAPSPSPKPTTIVSNPVLLSPHVLVALGPHGVAAMNCGMQDIAWPTDSLPIANKMEPITDSVESVSQAGGQPRVVARAKHGGNLVSPVPITEPWLVYIEYQQHDQSSSTDLWYLDAVNLTSGEVVDLASATAGAPLNALPRYSAADGRAVWDQLDANGAAVLRMYDFGTRMTTTLPLPAGAYPVNPVISGDQVVFVDNSTDPNRTSEDWLGRRGSLRRFDIRTGETSTLDADPTAFMAQIASGQVVWFAIPQSQSQESVKTVPLNGGKVRMIGYYQGLPETNGSIVVWYDAQQHRFLAFGLKDNRLVPLQVAGWPDPGSEFALCGNRLYFAIAPAVDGDTSTIRYVDLTAVSI